MRSLTAGAVLVSLLSGVALIPCSVAYADPQELKVLRVTPEGDDVPTTRQIVIEFNRPVVSLGQMDRTAEEVGVTISPATKCQWRWLNTSSLACQLDEKNSLPLATKFELNIAPRIAAIDGGKLAVAETHHFITERPATGYADFQTWKGPSSPVIRLIFNQPVSKSSVEKSLSFKDILSGKKQAPIVTADDTDHEAPVVLPLPNEKEFIFFERFLRKNDNQTTLMNGEEARRIWILEPKDPLPEDAEISLYRDAGLISAVGPEKGTNPADVVTFRTFPAPRFMGVHCSDNNNQDVLISPNASEKTDQKCSPLRSVSLRFATPMLRSIVKNNIQFMPDLSGGDANLKPWGEENRDYSRLGEPYRKDMFYDVWLPIGLKAAQTYTLDIATKKSGLLQNVLHKMKATKAVGIADEFDRGLPSDIHMSFKTDHRPPNYELNYSDAVLEKGIDSEVPLYVNNLSSIQFDYTTASAGASEQHVSLKKDVNPIEDIQYAVPLGVRDMLHGKSGVVYGHIDTTPKTRKLFEEGRLFAQVTPFQCDLKLGHFSSIVWVTDLATGQPVEGAKVAIYNSSFTDIASLKEPLATAVSNQDGIANLPGSDVLDPENILRHVWRDDAQRLFVRVEKDADIALLPVANSYLIDTSRVTDYQVDSTLEKIHGHMKSWGMTAQGIYHAGDNLQYKIYVRDQGNNGFIQPPEGTYKLAIVDPMGHQVKTIDDIRLDAFGAYAGEYTVPKSSPVGWYDFKLTYFKQGDKNTAIAAPKQNDKGEGSSEGKGIELHPMRVLVSDFTPAPFHVSNEIKGTHFQAGDTVDVSTLAQLHSGGAYGDAAVRVTATLNAAPFISKDITAEGFQFDSFKEEESSKDIFQKADKLDGKGGWQTSIIIPDSKIIYGTLRIESAVQDDRGKSIAGSSNVEYVGVDRLVGLKSTKWVFEKDKPATIDTLVVDDKGIPAAGLNIVADIEHQEVVTAKVKGAGNAYLSDTTVTWNKVDNCKLISTDKPVPCTFTPKSSGAYRLTASIKDTKGRHHQTQIGLWATGEDYVQWSDQSEQYTLPLIPEKKEWNVGDTARYLVKNPYPGAKALVSVERYGVLDSFVTTLEGSTPIISIPVKPDYVPGFYVSVSVVSPRVAGEIPKDGQIDMGKPAFRMGYVAVPVKDPYKDIIVKVTPENKIYRPRDMINVQLTATPKHNDDKKEPMELAVAVLDESVFDLIAAGRAAFDPYQGFYNLDSLDLENYSLLSALIGRQKFEKKGANVGGDGGTDLGVRDIFKFVSYWNPSVKLNSKGQATINFPAPDNLTGWRILAMAVTPTDKMGLGEGSFKVNRPTELRPTMPNQVHEGDRFVASFSVMNRTDKERTLDVNIEASGDVLGHKSVLKTEKVTLGSYKRTIVSMPLDVALLPIERDKPEGAIHFKASAADSLDSDATVHDVPVFKARTLEVGANYASTTADKATESIVIPKDIFTDIGDISVVFAPSVIGNLEGAFRYMRDYAYPCWEQQMTRAVMAAHYINLKSWVSDKFQWTDAAKVTQETLDGASAFQAPNGGMTYFVATDEHVDPYLSAYTAIAFGWMIKSGYHVPEDVSDKLDAYLLNFLKQDAAPDFYQKGMSSTVRAVALAALAQSHKVTADDVLRYRSAVPEMSLFGKAQFMDAAVSLNMPDIAKEIANKIFATGNETGGKFMFQEIYDDGYARILATPLRDNCQILSSFAHFAALPEGKELMGDKPFKLVRMITESRGNRDHWENTQENMFCMNALTDYARAYEQEKPKMQITAKLDATKIGEVTFADYKDPPQTVTQNLVESDAGKSTILNIEKVGAGRFYYSTRLRYAPKITPENVNSGFDIHREYSVRNKGAWAILKEPVALHRGDVVRVDLFVSLPAARNFVVVNDPLPGGLETVNRDLKTASGVDAAMGNFDEAGGSWWFKYGDWNEYDASFWSFYHKELRIDSARFYADYLPAGHYHLSYVAQAIADGNFVALPPRVEEMYNPDVYGIGSKGTLHVEAAVAP